MSESAAELKGQRFLEALERKNAITAEIVAKKELYGMLKKREQHMSDEEREKMAEVYNEVEKLKSELKDVLAELEG